MRTQKLKVTITLEFDADPSDDEGVQEAIYFLLDEQMADGVLEFTVVPLDDEDDLPMDGDDE